MSLRWFIDSADLNAWKDWMPSGMFFGMTTNPLLLERAGQACTLARLETLATTAVGLGASEIHIQTWGATTSEMVGTGERIAALDSHVVVKVPFTRDGATAAATLIARGVPVTMTGLYARHQAGAAMALGAAYAAPYLGRIEEEGRDGHGTVVAMQRMILAVESPMRLLVASLRNVSDMPALIQEGVSTFTLSPALLPRLFDDASTLAAIADFERAAKAMGA